MRCTYGPDTGPSQPPGDGAKWKYTALTRGPRIFFTVPTSNGEPLGSSGFLVMCLQNNPPESHRELG
ncbi:unnamed protein product [Merluccius merluccius]